ncbi:hypothetical protein, partial [Escherichia coli]|uniref:hypothetical protein n=1 Tax=Escherichia coli TaxID=562 RepID=UPI001BC84C6A
IKMLSILKNEGAIVADDWQSFRQKYTVIRHLHDRPGIISKAANLFSGECMLRALRHEIDTAPACSCTAT